MTNGNRASLSEQQLAEQARVCAQRARQEFAAHGQLKSPIPLPIIEAVSECEGVTTLWLEIPKEIAESYRPGQYFMCWNPYDSTGKMDRRNYSSEKPYSVGDIREDLAEIDAKTIPDSGARGRHLVGLTIKALGRQSGELTKMKRGDLLALRGPFGTHFEIPNGDCKLILVSGGIGSTPMHMAAREARRKLGSKCEIHAIMGFRREDEIHYQERMEGLCDSLTITTDDGSEGVHGYPTTPLGGLLDSSGGKRTILLTCGPEIMMKSVLQMAVDAGIECYAATERYLPCSTAVCGMCMIGDRLTCRQGPVMEGEWLVEQDDFGAPGGH